MLCGPTTFESVKALVAPGTPSDYSFEEIVSLLRVHYDPRPSELFSRCKLQRRDQLPRETVAAYVAALKALAAECNFGTLPSQPSSQPPRPSASESSGLSAAMSPAVRPDVRSTMLPIDVMLRYRFVCGLQDDNLQQRLFAEQDLTFIKAFDIAVLAENAKDYQKKVKADLSEVNKTARTQVSPPTQEDIKPRKPCYRCDDWHDPGTCNFRSARYRFCKKVGQVERSASRRKTVVAYRRVVDGFTFLTPQKSSGRPRLQRGTLCMT